MSSHEHHPQHSGAAISILKVDPLFPADVVAVTCPVQQVDGRLPDRYSAYYENVSPPLKWTNVPDVKAWAIIVEDPDAPREKPFLHWMMWNIEGQTISIPDGIGNAPMPITPQRGIQGKNDMGGYGWFGPRPPPGHGVHRYYFQVFALSDFLGLNPDDSLADLVNALKAYTLAKGEMAATYEAPTRQ